jgi:hypothetical protein
LGFIKRTIQTKVLNMGFINAELDEETHKKLKIICVSENITLEKKIEQIIEEYIKGSAKRC